MDTHKNAMKTKYKYTNKYKHHHLFILYSPPSPFSVFIFSEPNKRKRKEEKKNIREERKEKKDDEGEIYLPPLANDCLMHIEVALQQAISEAAANPTMDSGSGS